LSYGGLTVGARTSARGPRDDSSVRAAKLGIRLAPAARRRGLPRVRQDGRNAPSRGRSPVIRVAAVLAVGYVLGAKAGRRRYEQIAGTDTAITESPKTKAIIDAGRRKVADRVSPDPTMVTVTPIDASTSVLQPERDAR